MGVAYLASMVEPEPVGPMRPDVVSPGPTPAAPFTLRPRTLCSPSQNFRPISSNSRVDIHRPYNTQNHGLNINTIELIKSE